MAPLWRLTERAVPAQVQPVWVPKRGVAWLNRIYVPQELLHQLKGNGWDGHLRQAADDEVAVK
jgi:hypothetical protein